LTFKEATWDWVQDTASATTKWGAIGDWDVSMVMAFDYAFSTMRDFGGSFKDKGNPKAATFIGTDISKWITTSVTSLLYTFRNTAKMNADLSGWSVAKVITLQEAFNSASEFVGTGLDSWNTASVTSLSHTFVKASGMNADLSKWSVAKVTSLRDTFRDASKFAGVGLDSWDVSKVNDMMGTFTSTTSLTPCSKRKIADAWKSNSVFSSWNTAWAGETCPKVREDVG
jgi:hypothetical protein